MSIAILTTKIYIPQARSEIVARPRLIERLNEGLACKLTLVSAPAGFGKTTLLSQWIAASVNRHTINHCWFSIEKDDNDPARFWAYFIAALRSVRPGIGKAVFEELQYPQPPAAETVLTTLINEISAQPGEVVVVLDDYHMIEAPSIHKALFFLLDHLPRQLHLVIASRADPPWPLARLRSRQEIIELRAKDLRFTSDEAGAFLNKIMNLRLSSEDVYALEKRTEGWIAGLQMSAISMQGRSDLSSFIADFTGSNRYILDYLLEEVLHQQPPEIEDFLLKTSILERLSAPLCDAVIGDQKTWEKGISPPPTPLINYPSHSQELLEQLERANLFIVPLDSERRWYRYHHLFSDLLYNHLNRTWPEQVRELHSRASRWLEENDQATEALGHALDAGDIERAAHLAEQNALALLDHGQLDTLVSWLEAFSEEMVHSRPWLCVARAWVFVYRGQTDLVAHLLRDAEKCFSGESAQYPDQRLIGHMATIRAYDAWLQGRPKLAVEFAQRAMEALPEQDRRARSLAATTLGLALQNCGDLPGAGQALQQAVAIGRQAGNTHITVFAYGCLAYQHILRGQLHQAYAICQEGLKFAEEAGGEAWRGDFKMPILGNIYATSSYVLSLWNDQASAIRDARQGVDLATQWGQADTLHFARTSLIGALLSAGDLDEAGQILQAAKHSANQTSPWFIEISEAQEAGLNLAKGDVDAAYRWVQANGLDFQAEIHDVSDRPLTRAAVLIAQHKFDLALQLLDKTSAHYEKLGYIVYAIQAKVLRALAYQGQGQTDAALSVLAYALSLAESEGIARPFLDKGARMAGLLSLAVAKEMGGGYAGKLLAMVEDRAGSVLASGLPSSVNKEIGLIEPLSQREREVLRLLNSYLSSTEIAAELYISTYTVRSHIKNIYSKLNVHNRREAIERAKELDLF
jgi:LuxR family maltose regulon positive regulatory protein